MIHQTSNKIRNWPKNLFCNKSLGEWSYFYPWHAWPRLYFTFQTKTHHSMDDTVVDWWVLMARADIHRNSAMVCSTVLLLLGFTSSQFAGNKTANEMIGNQHAQCTGRERNVYNSLVRLSIDQRFVNCWVTIFWYYHNNILYHTIIYFSSTCITISAFIAF